MNFLSMRWPRAVVALVTQLALFPVVGLQATLPQNIVISCAFTSVSLVRSYALRRLVVSLERATRSPSTCGGEAP